MRHAEIELGVIAHRSVMAYIQRQLANLGLSQPQYWMLRHLSPDDPAPDGSGLTVAELAVRMRSYLDDHHDLEPDAEDLLERGLISRDADGRLAITDAGVRAHARVKADAPRIRAQIHDGIDDADYATMLTVLRRIIDNTGGAPGRGH